MTSKIPQYHNILSVRALLSDIKKELVALDADQNDKSFDLAQFELEVKFTVSESSNQDAGINLQVVKYGSETRINSEFVHSLRLTYKAIVDTSSQGAKRPARGTRFHPQSRPAPPNREERIDELDD